MTRQRLISGFALLAVIGWASLTNAATIVIVNKDPVGVGFNDPTAAAPVGGNSGTTLGQQRLNVFQAAAAIWGAKLSSPITIKIAASFGPLTPCSPGSGVIGSAGATNYLANFTNAPLTNVWYPVALASALSGTDQAAGLPDGASIEAQFNSNIGTAGCLTGTSWYLGLDANHGSQVDLETVLLHEFGHGLGFAGLVSISDGSTFAGLSDTFSRNILDNTTHLHWNVMSDGQRLTSLVNTGNVVFDGTNTTAGAATILTTGKDGSNHPKLYTPNPVVSGSSIYHFDTTASPNQIMEPSITSDLTHNVDAPNDLTAKTMYDIGWVAPSALAAPTSVVANGTTSGGVNLGWTAVGGATSYKVFRSPDRTTWTQVGTPAANSFSESPVAGAYLYKVHAVNATSESGDSNIDFATVYTFTDATIAAGGTIKGANITDLRTAANSLRTLAGLGAGTYADTINSSMLIKAGHITDIRTAIDQARVQFSVLGLIPGLSGASYTTNVISGATIQAADINDLRNAIK